MQDMRIGLCKGDEKLAFKNTLSGKIRFKGWAWVSAVLLLIAAGAAYRALASFIVRSPVKLPIALSALPAEIHDWEGTDLFIPATTQEYMEKNFADDFVSRRYVNAATNTWADVYAVYCSSRPGGMLGHEPRMCYPGHGWIHDSTEESEFTTRTGRQIACLIHRFHKPAPEYSRVVIPNFYIVNGRIATDQSGFSSMLGRKFNITRNAARYVAQVQISSVLENSIRTAAKDMTELILDFFPDDNGKVRVAENTNYSTSDLK